MGPLGRWVQSEARRPDAEATAVPRELAALPMRTLRPQQAAGVYAQPRGEVRCLERRGVPHRLSHGYYVVVPQEHVGTNWMPALETAAAGIATADFGTGAVVLMAVSAARRHGAIPRAIGTAVVAVPRQRNIIALADRTARSGSSSGILPAWGSRGGRAIRCRTGTGPSRPLDLPCPRCGQPFTPMTCCFSAVPRWPARSSQTVGSARTSI